MTTSQQCGAAIPPDAEGCVVCGPDRSSDDAAAAAGRDRSGDSNPTDPPRAEEDASTSPQSAPTERAPDGGGDPPSAGGATRQHRPTSRAAQHHRGGAGARSHPPTPTGVKLLAGLLGLSGAVQVLLGAWSLDAGGQARAVGAGGAGSTPTGLALLLVGLGLGYIVVAFGLWTLRYWGWSAGVVLLAAGSLGSLVLLVAVIASGSGPTRPQLAASASARSSVVPTISMSSS